MENHAYTASVTQNCNVKMEHCFTLRVLKIPVISSSNSWENRCPPSLSLRWSIHGILYLSTAVIKNFQRGFPLFFCLLLAKRCENERFSRFRGKNKLAMRKGGRKKRESETTIRRSRPCRCVPSRLLITIVFLCYIPNLHLHYDTLPKMTHLWRVCYLRIMYLRFSVWALTGKKNNYLTAIDTRSINRARLLNARNSYQSRDLWHTYIPLRNHSSVSDVEFTLSEAIISQLLIFVTFPILGISINR